MLTIYIILILVASAVWLIAQVLIARGVPSVSQFPAAESLPSLTVLMAGRNEEEDIERSVRSILAADYPDLSLVVANDRSTDRTKEILDRLVTEYGERLRVVHIDHLPKGWLGKSHALKLASQYATGEWLLFTDADVVFTSQAFRSAMAVAEQKRADHVVLFPRTLWDGYVEASVLTLFFMSLGFGFRIWSVGSRSLRSFIGIGAFNMIRRTVYDEFGGHEALRLEVVDDMKLGYLAKKFGGISAVANSDGQVRVRWRKSAIDIVRALERSGFSGMDFDWLKLAAMLLFLTGVMLLPYVLPLFAMSTLSVIGCCLAVTMMLISYAIASRVHDIPRWIGILHPIACILMIIAFVRSAVVTTIRGGLHWRETFYTVQELKDGTVK